MWNQILKVNKIILEIAKKDVLKGKLIDAQHLMFNKYLLATNVSISISLSAAGDILEQSYQNHFKKRSSATEWNSTRTLHMSISGATVGILCHHWYNILDKYAPGKSLRIIMKKIIIDQIVFSPIQITVFFLTLGALEKSSWTEISSEIIIKGKKLFLAEWVVWPPAQLFNFYFLSTKYRVLYDNTISLGYDVYTSHVRHDKSLTNHVRHEQSHASHVRHDQSVTSC